MNNDENWIWDYQYEDIPDKMDYDTWRSETGCSDTPENRGWYDCDSEDECAQYIKDHPEWWENF